MKLIKTLLLSSALSLIAPAAMAQSVLDVSDASKTPKLILPESCETDVKKMLENWYLQNYAVLDYNIDKNTIGEATDEQIIERLGALPTQIEMPFNSQVKSVINYYLTRKPQLVQNMLGLSLYYMPIFEEALERNGMPNELRYLPVIESALVPTAVSRAGAAGLWQFMPATATGLGLEVNSLIDQRRDPYLASEAGAKYLKQLYNYFGDWSLAIAAYNCGPGNVNKALRRCGPGKHDFWEIYPYLPQETRGYVPAFIAANYVMNYHKHHNISAALARKPLVVDTVHVNRRIHFEQISEVMGIPMNELRALNPQFRKDIIPGDIRPYSLVLPSLQTLAFVANEDSIANYNAEKYARRDVVEPATIQKNDSRGEYTEEEIVNYHKVKKGETFKSICSRYGITMAQLRKYNKLGKKARVGQKLKIVTIERRYKPAPEPETNTNNVETNNSQAAVADTTSIMSNEPIAMPNEEADGNDESQDEMDDSVSTASQVAGAFGKNTQKANEQPKETPKENKKATAKDKEPAKEKESVKEKDSAKDKDTSKDKNNKKGKDKDKQSNKKKDKTTTYTVRKGDNLSKIAKRNGTTVDAIKKANNLKDADLRPGDTLKIPKK